MNLRLDWCSYAAANFAVKHWHYSRQLPNQKLVKIGVWEDRRFVGAIVFGDGANPGMFIPYGLRYEEGCELVRIALAPHHQTTVTRLISISLKFMKRVCPRVRLIVSLADPEFGHHGGIYQGANWIYTGMTEAADEYIVNGIRMHGRALRSTRSTHPRRRVPASNVMAWARQVLDPKIQRVKGSSKHRYLLPLDDEIRARLKVFARPYPKRERSAENGTAVPAAGGGVIPTRSLQY